MGGWKRSRVVVAMVVGTTVLQLGCAAVGVARESGPTLWQRAFEADVVIRARIVHPRWEIPVGDPPTPCPVVEADTLEVLKGDVTPGRLTFARDGREAPAFYYNQETVLFLRAIDRSTTLQGTAVARAVQWASFPAPVENVKLTAQSRGAYLAAIRAYTTIATMPQSAERGARLRALTIDLVTSPEPALARSALRDLSLSGNAPLLTKTEASRLAKLVFDNTVPIETRLALLHATERRGLIFAPTAWARLLRETRGAELAAVLRAIRGHQSTAINIELEKMLDGPSRPLAIAAAYSLGSVGNREAVQPLLRALDSPDPKFRRVIVRALAGIRTQGARQALDLVAESHPDPETRRAALTEVLVLARRHGTTLAPMIHPQRDQQAAGAASRRPARSTTRGLTTRPACAGTARSLHATGRRCSLCSPSRAGSRAAC